jgi:WD40 repeat protein
MSTAQTNFYVIGGTLQRNAQSYVKRQADDDLYAGLGAKRFCYVLTSRQMGKSSLMVQTAARLRDEGVAVAVLDLTAVGQNLTAEQWYDGLLSSAGRQLKLEDELEDFWLDNERVGPLQRWMRAIREVVLERIKGRVVIFVDEIDAVRSLPFSPDEFFAAIRECYNRRTEDAELQRLTFCLLGVATPSDLIKDTRTTPFNIGQRIELTDFNEQEAAPLAAGLNRPDALAAKLLQRILYWTGGHPYLTQRLCQAVAEDDTITNTGGVDRLCEDLFLSARARERDDNLLFVRERLLRSQEADRAALLDLYAQVRAHKRGVRDDEANSLVCVLRLSGITRIVAGYHYVRNRIYYRVFDREWIIANMPDAELRRQRAAERRGMMRVAGVAAVILFVVSGLAFAAYREKRRADRNAVALKQALDLSEAQRALLIAQKQMEAQVKASEEQRQLAEQKRLLAEKSKQEALEQQAIIARQRELAIKQRAKAEAERKLAQTERQRAEVDAQRAETDKQRASRLLYAAQMSQAQQAWDGGNVDHARKLLSNYQPATDNTPASADTDMRGFEWHYLWRLANNILSSISLPLQGAVRLTAFSHDGTRLATTSGEEGHEIVNVWDAQTGQRVNAITPAVYSLQNIDPHISALAMSPDGTKLVTGQQGSDVALLDASTGQLLRTLNHQDAARAIAPGNGEQESQPRDIQFRRVGLSGNFDTVRAVAFSPDGRLLATGRGSLLADFARARDVKLWDAATGQEFATLVGHTSGINAIAFAPDGKLLATASADKTIKLWAVPATRMMGQPVSPITTLATADNSVRLLTFSPDGRILATCGDDQIVRLWDMRTGQRLGPNFAGHTKEVTAIAFAPDGRKFATTSADNTIRVWAVPIVEAQPERAPANGAAMQRTSWPSWLQPAVYRSSANPSTSVLSAPWPSSPPAAFNLTGNLNADLSADDFIRERTAEPLTVLKGHKGAVLSLRFSTDGQKLMTIGADETLKVWPVEREQEWRTFGTFAGAVNGLAFTPDGRSLAIGSIGSTETLSLWDTKTGQEQLSFKPGGPIFNVSFSSDGKLLAAAGPNTAATLWDAATGRELTTLKHPADVFALSFAPNSRLLATGCRDGTVKLWDVNTTQEIATLRGHTNAVEAIAFAPDRKLLATASHDSTIKLWDVATRQERATLKENSAVRAVAFSPDGKLLATGGADKLLRLWDATTGQPLAALEGHTKAITYIAFSPDGRRIATTGEDGTVLLWAVESQQELIELKGHSRGVYVVAFAPDGQTIATGNQDGTVRLFDTTDHPPPQTQLTPSRLIQLR